MVVQSFAWLSDMTMAFTAPTAEGTMEIEVRPMPMRFDADALHTAAGTLPPAIEVKAIEDCTVEGNRLR